MFFRLGCFPDKCTNLESNSCIVNVIKRTRDRNDGGRRKKATPSIFVMDARLENTNGKTPIEAMKKAAEAKQTGVK